MKYLIVIILAIYCTSCANTAPKQLIAPEQAIQIDSIPGQCPFLTKDENGNTAMSWVRMVNDSTSAFCYAICKDGKTFGTPVVIPNSSNIQPHGENLPKIIFKPSHEIIALWGAANPNPKNKYSGLVFYVQSFDAGKNWTAPKPLVNDTASYDQRYYDIALLPNGEAGIIWLDNRKTIPNEGSALFFATTQGRNGFENARLISQPCCQCCRTDLFIDKKGSMHVLYRGIINDSIRDMVHMVSTDAGKTFTAPERISNDNWVLNGCPHTGPAMTENADGLHFSWFTGGKIKGCFYTRSTDNGKTFVQHDSVSAQGSHPQLASLTNGTVVIVWDESKVVNSKLNKKIGIQVRDKDGKSEGLNFLTADSASASFPVLSTVNDHQSMVAYTLNNGDKPYITYQLVTIN
ncbi:hypothetical protein A4H97_24145 [Niastella yeongjuensis]|uniref:Sialidase domain-containing protein n=1 Tax=Niastella yeongjuensis TaxID=354355 RepID=A0A1V9F3H4_9BACT|nr:sialidase family protein [Niastella yeongjuensis]OQP52795.1 hypothetical protein A4H97_24145 [Niastella yeongjuensis]SEP19963.1 BNR repeat-like domain-containing protein [Niastella yeongjuensis]